MTIPVFRNGTWVQIKLHQPFDVCWSEKHKLQAASFCATAIHQGHSAENAASLAEAYVQQSVYPGMKYNSTLEKQIQTVISRAETT